MSEGTVRHIAELELPFGRRAMLREVKHESGLRMLRLILREGKRITRDARTAFTTSPMRTGSIFRFRQSSVRRSLVR